MKTAIYNAPTGENVRVTILETWRNDCRVRVESCEPVSAYYPTGREFWTALLRLTNVKEGDETQ